MAAVATLVPDLSSVLKHTSRVAWNEYHHRTRPGILTSTFSFSLREDFFTQKISFLLFIVLGKCYHACCVDSFVKISRRGPWGELFQQRTWAIKVIPLK